MAKLEFELALKRFNFMFDDIVNTYKVELDVIAARHRKQKQDYDNS